MRGEGSAGGEGGVVGREGVWARDRKCFFVLFLSSLLLLLSLCSVFLCLPKLEILDGIPKLPEDSRPTRLQFPESARMCSIL